MSGSPFGRTTRAAEPSTTDLISAYPTPSTKPDVSGAGEGRRTLSKRRRTIQGFRTYIYRVAGRADGHVLARHVILMQFAPMAARPVLPTCPDLSSD